MGILGRVQPVAMARITGRSDTDFGGAAGPLISKTGGKGTVALAVPHIRIGLRPGSAIPGAIRIEVNTPTPRARGFRNQEAVQAITLRNAVLNFSISACVPMETRT